MCDELGSLRFTFRRGRHQWLEQLECKRSGRVPSDVPGSVPSRDGVFEAAGHSWSPAPPDGATPTTTRVASVKTSFTTGSLWMGRELLGGGRQEVMS